MDIAVAAEEGAFTGLTIDEIESRTKGAFLIVQLKHRSGKTIDRPPAIPGSKWRRVVVIGRNGSLAYWRMLKVKPTLFELVRQIATLPDEADWRTRFLNGAFADREYCAGFLPRTLQWLVSVGRSDSASVPNLRFDA